jgi:ATP-dependent exoDNAse (exonuclease V) beta subunit
MNPASAQQWMSAPGHMVEASAGTGKTTRLVQEFVNAIQAGADVRRILAVTFTHAAAGDLKLRIRQKLDDALTTTTGVTRDRLRTGIEYLEQSYIGTIHGFCAQCLRQRPVEAALDPSFVELAEMESAALFAKVFKRWLERRLAHGSPTLDRAFSRLAYRDEKNQDPIGPLLDSAWKLADWRDFPTPWRQPKGFDRDKLRGLLARVAEATAGWKGASSNYQYLKATLFPAAELGERVRIATEASALDDDSLEAELCYVGRRHYEQTDFTALHNRLPNAYTQWQRLLTDLAAYSRDADANFAAELRDELWEMVLEYDLAKKAAGAVDFQDLLLKTRDLLLDPQARAWFQQKFDHVFVDEFQDTDPLQAEILLLLSADDPAETNWRNVTPQPGKLFLVGDPKQSIYRFRRAEVALYRQVAQQLTRDGATTTPLTTSYRSVLPIQQFVNSAFATTMEPYLALEGGREPIPGQPGVVALPVPRSSAPLVGQQREVSRRVRPPSLRASSNGSWRPAVGESPGRTAPPTQSPKTTYAFFFDGLPQTLQEATYTRLNAAGSPTY